MLDGTAMTAIKDFASLHPGNIRIVSTDRGDVRVGTLDDGSTAILRPSKDGRMTIELPRKERLGLLRQWGLSGPIRYPAIRKRQLDRRGKAVHCLFLSR